MCTSLETACRGEANARCDLEIHPRARCVRTGLIYKNSGQTNQAIFESSQGRFYGGYWDNLEAYMRNSPVFHARNVKTPLMLLHNDRDGAVDFTQERKAAPIIRTSTDGTKQEF